MSLLNLIAESILYNCNSAKLKKFKCFIALKAIHVIINMILQMIMFFKIYAHGCLRE